MEIKIKILEQKEGVYEGNPYAYVIARYNGSLLKFKVDAKKVKGLGEYIDQDVLATVDIVSGAQMSATLKIVGIEAE